MRNLYNPTRWYAVINGAGEKEQQDIFHPYGVPFSAHPKGEWVLWTDYLHLLESYKLLQKREGELSIKATVDEIAISQMKDEIKRLNKLNEESTRSRNNQSDNLGVAQADASSGSETQEENQRCVREKEEFKKLLTLMFQVQEDNFKDFKNLK